MNYFLYNNTWNQKNTKNSLDSKFTVEYEAIFYFSKTVIFLIIHHIGFTILNFENLKLDIKSSMIETLSSDHDHSCNGPETPLTMIKSKN